MLPSMVRKTIEEHNLLQNGDTVICAVSGGADSVCLLHLMINLKKEYNLSVCVAHVNHMIRKGEAERDGEFVRSICKMADVECFYREYDVVKIAREKKIGEEECGRILRYEFFDEIAGKLGGAKIATAHNLNDNAETILFRLARGSSAGGLTGIKYKRKNIIRPLLDISRDEIEKYLRANGLTWCEDSTNAIPIYARNKLRLNVIPSLEEIYGEAQKKIVSAAKLISEDNEYLSYVAEIAQKSCFFKDFLLIERFSELPIPIKRRIVSNVLKIWGAQEITSDKIVDFLEFLNKENGKQFDINSVCYSEKAYDRVVLRKRFKREEFFAKLDVNNPVSDAKWKLTAQYTLEPPKPDRNNIAVFDAEKLMLPLDVRYKKDGDKISLKGMKGSKKISDIFTDEKVDRFSRNQIPIIEKDSNILYIGGLRQSSDYYVDKNTKKYLVIKYTEDKKYFKGVKIKNVKYQRTN